MPLSEYNYINSAFHQIQDPSVLHESTDFTSVHQTSLSPDGSVPPTNHASSIGDCPTIHEEPTFTDDSSAFMSFLGIDDNGSGHVQLHDVNQISMQFNPDSRGSESMLQGGQMPPPYHASAHSPAVAGISHSQPQMYLDPSQAVKPGTTVASHDNSRRPSGSMLSGSGSLADESMFVPGWSFPTGHEQNVPFDLQQARDMVHQLQERASSEGQQPHDHHAFGYPTSQTPMETPQPLTAHQASFATYNQNVEVPLHAQTQAVKEESEEPFVSDDHSAPTRTDSGTSLLADGIHDVSINPHRPSPMRPPSASSLSFAQRRQKRPANISAGATRSYSSGQTPLSATDRNSLSAGSSEAHLRRIKSSTGVLNGRVQKSGQRSPLHQWSIGEGHSLHKQISASSLNAALKGENAAAHGHMPSTSSHQGPFHAHNPSTSSGLTHLTVPDNQSQSADSIWSAMPGTADTPTTSVYHSVPQTANTVKSYTSPPISPMDHAQFAAMHFQQSGLMQPVPPGFPGFQPQPDSYQIPHRGILSPHTTPNEQQVQYNQSTFSTEDLLMNSIPAGQSPFNMQGQWTSAAPSHFNETSAGPSHGAITTDNFSLAHGSQQPSVVPLTQPGSLLHEATPMLPAQSPYEQQSQQNHFMWSLQPELGAQQTGQPSNPDLQIHQFTPQNPVDPSNLPPKVKHMSPRQNFSFQNFGPDYYSSPQSQSSHSKTSSPGPLQLGG